MAQDLTFDEVENAPTSPSDRLERYKGTEGNVDRIAITFFRVGGDGKPDLTKPRLIKGKIRFHSKLGTVAVDETIEPELWATFEAERDKAATLVTRYVTEPDGSLVKARLKEMRPMLWEFGDRTLESLMSIHTCLAKAGKSLASVDLLVTCQSSRYQRFQIQPTESCIWRKNSEFASQHLSRVLPHYEQVRIGRPMTEQQIREALGMQAPVVEVPAAEDGFDMGVLEDLMNQV